MEKFKKEVIDLLKKEAELNEEDIILEAPPSEEMGDFAFPCFSLSKKLKKNPVEICQELGRKIQPSELISKIECKGPYLNFFLNSRTISEKILTEINTEEDFGGGKEGKKIMVEYCAPNTNKPLHLGHLRNMSIGSAVSRILKFRGNKVIEANLMNDRGIHICKSMLAYKMWGKNSNPKSSKKKPDHFVGAYYVMFSQRAKGDKSLEEQALKMLNDFEQGDKKTTVLWKKMNNWAYRGFNQTFREFGIKFDRVYYESEFYAKGKEIVGEGLHRGIFKKDEKGAIIADLEKFGLPNKVLVRADGTAIYITQDIALAEIKFEEHNLDNSIYVVASEQNLHFQQLFRILELLGHKSADKNHHLSYGLVNLPEGRMKSREGTVVDADDLFAEMKKLAKEEIEKRHEKLNKKELAKRTNEIGIGAIKYFMLRVDPSRDMLYDPKESISFEGETAPYIQYAHARICSILKKYGNKSRKTKAGNEVNFGLLNKNEEIMLVKHLSKFPEIVEASSKTLKPYHIAGYAYELAKKFNEFYHTCIVIDNTNKELTEARILLVECVRKILEKSLYLLGISAPKRM
ncbi:MAG TPA: arginine--tRNA ligase [Candidatus Nanoarchaeia archaeon]|nr:arginine--tRNA ligase [Candidatus Nanoarchaeia archaeon]